MNARFAVLVVILLTVFVGEACGGGDRAAPVAEVPPAATEDPGIRAREARRQRQLRREIRRVRERAAMRMQADRGGGGSGLGAGFGAVEAAVGGTAGVAVATADGVVSGGSLRTGVAWSTGKLPVVMAGLERGVVETGSADVVAAITASDNAAAQRVWEALGGGTAAAAAADAALRSAGDTTTAVPPEPLRAEFSAFGQTEWSLGDQARFVAGMRCSSAGRDVLALMSRVTPDQRWGLGTLPDARFKGGWGPGSEPGVAGGYLDRQVGLVRLGGREVAVAIAVQSADGSHATGTAALTRIAAWLQRRADALPPGPDCP